MNKDNIDQLINEALRTDMQVPSGLSERLERTLDSAYATTQMHRKPNIRRILIAASSVAASLFLILAIQLHTQRSTLSEAPITALTDTFEDPADAAVAADAAFRLLSENLNKGFRQINKK